MFLSHFEPKTSHNARFWGPNTLVFWGHRAPTIWANKKRSAGILTGTLKGAVPVSVPKNGSDGQQFTYGVVCEGFFGESLRKFCGKFAEIWKMRFVASGKGAEILQQFAKFRGHLRNIFCNDPFPKDPISSELLRRFRFLFRFPEKASAGSGPQKVTDPIFVNPPLEGLLLRTLFPLTAFKNAPSPKFVQNLSWRLFFGVPIRGTQICQKFVENLKSVNFRTNFHIFDKFLTNLGPPDWNPEKQSSGQILDKFGVRGVFECCKGKKGSQDF